MWPHDQHTVKPVVCRACRRIAGGCRFADQGYPLVGGRTDYLDHQRAAVVVPHGAHVINVFSWAAPRAGGQAHHPRCYHLSCWSAGNLVYCAVSDTAGTSSIDWCGCAEFRRHDNRE